MKKEQMVGARLSSELVREVSLKVLEVVLGWHLSGAGIERCQPNTTSRTLSEIRPRLALGPLPLSFSKPASGCQALLGVGP